MAAKITKKTGNRLTVADAISNYRVATIDESQAGHGWVLLSASADLEDVREAFADYYMNDGFDYEDMCALFDKYSVRREEEEEEE